MGVNFASWGSSNKISFSFECKIYVAHWAREDICLNLRQERGVLLKLQERGRDAPL